MPSAPPFSPGTITGDPGKFKLKPKTQATTPADGSQTVPLLFLPDDLPVKGPGQQAPGSLAATPFSAPVSTQPPVSDPAGRAGKSNPPISVPYVKVQAEDLAPEVDIVIPRKPAKGEGVRRLLIVCVVLGAAGYGIFKAWPKLPAEFSAFGYTVRTKPGLTITKARAASPSSVPTPSEALNKLAQLPANAINKAQDALNARRNSGQDRVDAAADGEDLPTKAFGVPPAAPIKPAAPVPKAPKPTAVTTLAPGLSATMPVEAAPDASPEFRAFVTNARVSGVFQGTPARAVVNGRLIRAGEVVDAGLGITFEGIDSDRRSLMFKDRAGATVARRF